MAELSPFTHLAAVPGATPDWVATVAFVVIVAVLIGAGLLGYQDRDLTT
jgi:ABC-2 type transport system permease protein